MDETQFHALADAVLDHVYDRLDGAFENSSIDDMELQGGVLSVTTASGTTLILSKHSASKQIWLASPVSGGLHFAYDAAAAQWKLTDGRELLALLTAELASHAIAVTL